MDRGVLCAVNDNRTIRVSVGTAAALGLVNVRCDILPSTAYLMTCGGCVSRCAFCAQARSSNSSEALLSRVSWPEFPIEQVLDALARGNSILQRVCVQVTSTSTARKTTKELVSDMMKIRQACGFAHQISLSYHPSSVSDVESLFALGVDRIGIALDAATQRIHERTKAGSGSWAGTLRLIEESSARFPGRISTHLIVGLGETEEELVNIIQHMKDLGITIGLFAFTPVKGTPMERVPQPQPDTYRRVQIARHLITGGYVTAQDFSFANGRILDVGLAPETLRKLISDGAPFETSGCPDCNRPYYNERPGGVTFNYPRSLTEAEIQNCILEAKLEGLETEDTPRGSKGR